ncbi:hypothetical protein [Pedobacter endophyticus]|uniref:Uncharacterized protein n=1 Tax=Pedobacter endophyticus TaxID=2789740 RepID=A0A7S9KYW2_9SPHI|nr:hypothetical protein [Pedobacter endophyticus]QPH39407.1 hypothetical protein IZT61_20585 [Pedobacter endophyticus]
MNHDNEPRIISVGKRVAQCSAVIGTFIFLCFMVLNRLEIAIFGLAFIFSAALGNLIVVLVLLIEMSRNVQYRSKIAATILYTLLNIPLVVCYSFIATKLIF